METVKPHVFILGCINESPIGIGKNLLADILTGSDDARIKKLKLHRLFYYNSLPLYSPEDIFSLLDMLVKAGLVKYASINQNKFMKVLALSERGFDELKAPKLNFKIKKSRDNNFCYSNLLKVTEEDRKIFEMYSGLLAGLSDEQKKAVICDLPRILCLAGAGSGKTRTLTMRIWYLVSLKSVDPNNILAITFTRKARIEMMQRLSKLLPNHSVQVETFNSFCEKILRKNENDIYEKKMEVLDYKLQIRLIVRIMAELGLDEQRILDIYYGKKRFEEPRTLFLRFIGDIFSLIEYQKNNRLSNQELLALLPLDDMGKLVKEIIEKIWLYKENLGYRDFTDQIVHAIDFLKEGNAPKYSHILVDEFQDINSLQSELIDLLSPENLFAVGDPRQSIFGWRGSKIDYILDFESLYESSSIIPLNTNYRSCRKIVDISNKVIRPMKLPDISSDSDEDGDVLILRHDNEESELLFVCQSIISLEDKKNVFVLARTNRQIEKLSSLMDQFGIKYLKRTVEDEISKDAVEGEITISTIHAIKGMEADYVYVIGASTKYHPCRASEHPLLEQVKFNEDYDKFGEELRLFYVALTRAKKKLIINYSDCLTAYIDDLVYKKYSVENQ